jgi:hypothetical protein
MKLELEKYNIVTAAVQETEWKGERITDAGYFIMFYSRKMVNYISDTGLTSMANQSTQRWVNVSGKPQSTSIPVHGRWRGHSSMLDTCKVDVWETGVANLHQDRTTSLREMEQQDTTWTHQWFTSLSLLLCVSSKSISMWPKETGRSWSWNPNLKHQASSYPGSCISCLNA